MFIKKMLKPGRLLLVLLLLPAWMSCKTCNCPAYSLRIEKAVVIPLFNSNNEVPGKHGASGKWEEPGLSVSPG